MRAILLGSLLSFGLAQAETVEWIAEGAVTSTGGVFGEAGIAVDEVVSVSFTYEDDAGFNPLKLITFPGFEEDRDYYDGVNLAMKVVIGERTWEGMVETGTPGRPETLFFRRGVFTDRLDPLVREEESGVFSSFPLSHEDGKDSVGIKFLGSFVFSESAISADVISPVELTSAIGTITTGGDALGFSLSIASIEVREIFPDPIVPELEIVGGEESVTLAWASVVDQRYQLQMSSTLEADDWMTIETRDGNGELIDIVRARAAETVFYRLLQE